MARRVVRPVQAREDGIEDLDPAALTQQVRTLLAEAQALSARLAALNEVTVAMQSDLSVEAILHVVTREARWLLDFQRCSVALCSSDGATYYELVLLGESSSSKPRVYPHDFGAIGQSLQNRHALLIHKLEPENAPPDMLSALILPLRSGGDNIGTLNFFAAKPHHYTQSDLRVASAFAGQVAATLQNGRMFAATQQARDELRTVLESIGDAVLVLDANSRIRLINRAAQAMLSLSEKEVVGRRGLWLQRLHYSGKRRLIPADTFHALMSAWNAQSSNGTTGTCQLANGRYFEWAYAPLRGTGTSEGGVVSFRDISARVELEQMRDDMLHMLVHDLRTPLTGVLMGLDMLLMPGDFVPPEDRESLLTETYRAADNLLEQLNTVLDVRKLEVGRMELELASIAVAELIEHALSPVLSLIQYNRQELKRAIAGGLPEVVGDVRLLKRVIGNFLGNAIKFASLEGQVMIGADYIEDRGCVQIWVADNGPGVPETLRALLFEKYSQAPGEERRGTGLGLAFCKLVVTAHGGQIGMRDRPDEGSIFWFELPVLAEQPE